MEAMACLLPISRNLPASVTPRCLQASGFSHIDLRVGHHYRTCCRPASDLCRSSRSLLGLHASKVPRSMLASTKRHTNSAFPTLLRSLSSTSVKTSSPGKPSKPPGEQPSQKVSRLSKLIYPSSYLEKNCDPASVVVHAFVNLRRISLPRYLSVFTLLDSASAAPAIEKFHNPPTRQFHFEAVQS
ncbi:hypothetical protein IWX50DRAFT_384720 [Phyllosticta citricarpa]